MNFSIGEAWAQCTAFISANLQTLLITVGGANIVAALLQFVAGGPGQAQQMAMMQQIMSGNANMADMAAMGAAGQSALALPLTLIGALIASAASFAALRIGLSNNEEDLPSAFTYGLGATVMIFLVYIGVAIVAGLALVIPAILLGLGGGSGAGIMGLLVLVLIPVFIWLSARLSVIQPAMADARTMNPITGIQTSWRLTRGHALPIVGYLIVLGVAILVIFFVVGMVVGLLASGAGLFGVIVRTLLLTIPFAIAGVGITAGIYRALVPTNAGQIFA